MKSQKQKCFHGRLSEIMGKVGGAEVQDHFERFWVYTELFQGLGDQETQK